VAKIATLFDRVRVVLNDPNANLYKDDRQVLHYNRIIAEVQATLMRLGANLAMTPIVFEGDGLTQSFDLPAGFLAFVPKQVRQRAPAAATTNFSHGTAVQHVDHQVSTMPTSATAVAMPIRFVLDVAGSSQSVRFDTILPAGSFVDALAYVQIPEAEVATIGDTDTPWLGLLDQLLLRSLEQYCREGLEFTTEARAVWRSRTEADVQALLGLRHLQTQEKNPSLWKGFSW